MYVFLLKIYYQPLSNSINNLSFFHSLENGDSIVQIEVSILFIRMGKLRPREDDWYSKMAQLVNNNDRKLLLTQEELFSWYYTDRSRDYLLESQHPWEESYLKD